MKTAIFIVIALAVVTAWGYFVADLQNQAAGDPLLVTAAAAEISVAPSATPPAIPTTLPARKLNRHRHAARSRANRTADQTQAMLHDLSQ